MSNIQKPPLDASMLDANGKLKSPWFEYFEHQTKGINSLTSFDINSLTDTTITASDEIAFADASDSNNLKKDTVQGIIDLVPTGSIVNATASLTAASSSTATTWTDVPSLSVTITPTSASDKVLLMGKVYCCQQLGAYTTGFKLLRDSTDIGIGDAASSRTQVHTGILTNTSWDIYEDVPICWVDSPSTTSSITYKIQFKNLNSGTTYFNRTVTDTNSATYYRAVSYLTAIVLKA